MANLPQVRRFMVENFLSEKEWIARLFQPLNVFMESVATAFNKGLTIKENMAADIKTVILDRVPTAKAPFLIQWNLGASPVSVHIGNVQKDQFESFALTAAVGVQWVYNRESGLFLTNLVGIAPTKEDKYILTLVVFTG